MEFVPNSESYQSCPSLALHNTCQPLNLNKQNCLWHFLKLDSNFRVKIRRPRIAHCILFRSKIQENIMKDFKIFGHKILKSTSIYFWRKNSNISLIDFYRENSNKMKPWTVALHSKFFYCNLGQFWRDPWSFLYDEGRKNSNNGNRLLLKDDLQCLKLPVGGGIRGI